jgi:hypothetical protein
MPAVRTVRQSDPSSVTADLLGSLVHAVRFLSLDFSRLGERMFFPGGPVADALVGAGAVGRARMRPRRTNEAGAIFVLSRSSAGLFRVHKRRGTTVLPGAFLVRAFLFHGKNRSKVGTSSGAGPLSSLRGSAPKCGIAEVNLGMCLAF